MPKIKITQSARERVKIMTLPGDTMKRVLEDALEKKQQQKLNLYDKGRVGHHPISGTKGNVYSGCAEKRQQGDSIAEFYESYNRH